MKTLDVKRKIIIKTTLAFILVITVSCQKVITIDLNTSNPQLVIEANISDQQGPYTVKLSKTVSFNNITNVPLVSGANIVISDSIGNNDTLIEKTAGIYFATDMYGIPGKTYRLSILTESKKYEAISYMPFPVDSFKLDVAVETTSGRPSIGGGEKKKRYQVNYDILDPEQFKNYYRFVVYLKNKELSSRRVFDDQFNNGKHIIGEFRLNDTAAFNPGDTILVKLQNIDQATYNYYRTLRTGAGGLGFLSASPSNPISNISGDGLGYFSAHSERFRILIIPK